MSEFDSDSEGDEIDIEERLGAEVVFGEEVDNDLIPHFETENDHLLGHVDYRDYDLQAATEEIPQSGRNFAVRQQILRERGVGSQLSNLTPLILYNLTQYPDHAERPLLPP